MTQPVSAPARRRGPSLWLVLAPVILTVLLLLSTIPYIMTTPDMADMAAMHDMRAVGGSFRLVDGNNRPVTDRSWPGRWQLIYFGYTHCPASCPTALNSMAEAVDSMGAEGKTVQPLFITVDPARDTPAIVKEYAAQFSPTLVGLTGSDAAVAEAAGRYKIHYRKRDTGSGSYAMDHSSIVYLMRPDGRLGAMIPATDPPPAMAKEIREAMR
jgi:protein SCO1